MNWFWLSLGVLWIAALVWYWLRQGRKREKEDRDDWMDTLQRAADASYELELTRFKKSPSCAPENVATVGAAAAAELHQETTGYVQAEDTQPLFRAAAPSTRPDAGAPLTPEWPAGKLQYIGRPADWDPSPQFDEMVARVLAHPEVESLTVQFCSSTADNDNSKPDETAEVV